MAQLCDWSVVKLARKCNVSVRTLERFFLQTHGLPPREWLSRERQKTAVACLQQGLTVKETAARVGYKTLSGFTRACKRYHGVPPSLDTSC